MCYLWHSTVSWISWHKTNLLWGRKAVLLVLHTELAQPAGWRNTGVGARNRVRLLVLVATSCETGSTAWNGTLQPWDCDRWDWDAAMNAVIPHNPGLGPGAGAAGDKCEDTTSCQHLLLPLALFKTGMALPLGPSPWSFETVNSLWLKFPFCANMNGTEPSISSGIAMHMEGRCICPYKLHSSSPWWEKHEACYLFKKFEKFFFFSPSCQFWLKITWAAEETSLSYLPADGISSFCCH